MAKRNTANWNLAEQVEKVIEVVQETNKVVTKETSTIELVDPIKTVKPPPVKVAKPVRRAAVNRTTTKKTATAKTKTVKKTTKE